MVIENGKYYEVGRRGLLYLILDYNRVSIVILVISLLVTIAGAVTPGNFGTLVALGGVFLFVVSFLWIIIASVIAKLEYVTTKIMLDDVSLRVVRGILSKEEDAIPFRRIQTVDIKQDILQRVLSVAHLVIATTTDLDTPGMTVSEKDEEVVPIMEYDLASALAEALTSRAEVERLHIEAEPAAKQSTS